MYIPEAFRVRDPGGIAQMLRRYSFGLLISIGEDERTVGTHLPMLYDEQQGLLLAHLARANPQWRHLDGSLVHCVFSGPHTYISPSWYATEGSVPTWNYTAVHAYGRCSVLEDGPLLADILQKMVGFYEPDSPLLGQTKESFYLHMMKGVVGISVQVEEIQAAAKLSQNKTRDVQMRVVAELVASDNPDNLRVGQAMQENLRLRGANKLDVEIRPLMAGEDPPMELLLLADPSRGLIMEYLQRGSCFVARHAEARMGTMSFAPILGVYVLLQTRPGTVELVNVAVHPAAQRSGLGKSLVLHAVEEARKRGYQTIEIGTGNSSVHQLMLYQRCGFRVTGVDSGFFVRHYSEEIYENGLQCRDMIRLTLDLHTSAETSKSEGDAK